MHTANSTDGGPAARPAGRALSDWHAEYVEGATARVRYQMIEFADASTLDELRLITEHPETGEPVEVVGMVFADGSHWPDD